MPVIDGCYPLSKTPEAFWYFEKEHPRGKIVISDGLIHIFVLSIPFIVKEKIK